jgi:chromate transporter
MSAFGGAGAWAQRIIVDDIGWLSPGEYADTLALCQSLPGMNITNMAVVIGSRFRGAPGALAAITALLVPPMAIVMTLAALYAATGENAVVRGMLAGLASAAAGLFITNLVRLIRVLVDHHPIEALPIALISFGAVAFANIALPLVLVVLAPVSTAAAWWRRR